jgi:hypothetical protein
VVESGGDFSIEILGVIVMTFSSKVQQKLKKQNRLTKQLSLSTIC